MKCSTLRLILVAHLSVLLVAPALAAEKKEKECFGKKSPPPQTFGPLCFCLQEQLLTLPCGGWVYRAERYEGACTSEVCDDGFTDVWYIDVAGKDPQVCHEECIEERKSKVSKKQSRKKKRAKEKRGRVASGAGGTHGHPVPAHFRPAFTEPGNSYVLHEDYVTFEPFDGAEEGDRIRVKVFLFMIKPEDQPAYLIPMGFECEVADRSAPTYHVPYDPQRVVPVPGQEGAFRLKVGKPVDSLSYFVFTARNGK